MFPRKTHAYRELKQNTNDYACLQLPVKAKRGRKPGSCNKFKQVSKHKASVDITRSVCALSSPFPCIIRSLKCMLAVLAIPMAKWRYQRRTMAIFLNSICGTFVSLRNLRAQRFAANRNVLVTIASRGKD